MTAKQKIVVNMISESDISVQGHGVHTAYVEMANALDHRNDVELIRGEFGKQVSCDVVHMHTIGMRTWKKIRQPNVKKVVSAHIIPDSFIGSIILAKYWRFAAKWYMHWYYNKADKVLAVSAMVAESLRHELHVPEHKIEVLHNTIDMNVYTPTSSAKVVARKKLAIESDSFVVLGVGQVQPRKRLDTFVTMAKAQPDVQFVWVGGIPFQQLGADYKKMQQLIDKVPQNMRITGVIDHQLVREYYHAADVFCLPAEQENHPMCVLEAAGAGLPIIVRDITEYDDTFGDDVLRCATDEEFIDAVKYLKRVDVRNEWRKKSQRVRDRFDTSKMTERLVAIYQGLV